MKLLSLIYLPFAFSIAVTTDNSKTANDAAELQKNIENASRKVADVFEDPPE